MSSLRPEKNDEVIDTLSSLTTPESLRLGKRVARYHFRPADINERLVEAGQQGDLDALTRIFIAEFEHLNDVNVRTVVTYTHRCAQQDRTTWPRVRDSGLWVKVLQKFREVGTGKCCFIPRDVVNLLKGCRIIRLHVDDATLASLSPLVESTIKGFMPKELVFISAAFEPWQDQTGRAHILGVVAEALVEQGAWKTRHNSLSQWQLAGLAKRFSTTHPDKKVVEAVAAAFLERVTDATVDGGALSTLIRCSVSMSVDVTALVTCLCDMIVVRSSAMSHRDLALAACALARSRSSLSDPRVLPALRNAATALQDKLTPQDISMLCWAVGSLGTADTNFMRVLSQAAQRSLSGFTSRDFHNVIWAHASLSCPDPQLFASVSSELQRREVGMLAPKDLIYILWGFVTCKVPDERLVELVLTQTRAAVESFSAGKAGSRDLRHVLEPRDLCTLSWSLAVWGLRDFTVEHAVATQLRQDVDTGSLDPMSVALLCVALARWKWEDTDMFRSIARAVEMEIEAFVPYQIQMLVWSFGMARFYPRSLFNQISTKLKSLPNPVSPSSHPILLWTLAVLRADQFELVDLVLDDLSKNIKQYSRDRPVNRVIRFANLAWPLAVMGRYDDIAPLLSLVNIDGLGPGRQRTAQAGTDNTRERESRALNLRAGAGAGEGVEASDAGDQAGSASSSGMYGKRAILGERERDGDIVNGIPKGRPASVDEQGASAGKGLSPGDQSEDAAVPLFEGVQVPEKELNMLAAVHLGLTVERPDLKDKVCFPAFLLDRIQDYNDRRHSQTRSHVTPRGGHAAHVEGVRHELEALLGLDAGVTSPLIVPPFVVDVAVTSRGAALDLDSPLQYISGMTSRHSGSDSDIGSGSVMATLEGAVAFRDRVLGALGWMTLHLPVSVWMATAKESRSKLLLSLLRENENKTASSRD